MDIQEYIRTRVDDQIGWFNKKSQQNQFYFKWLRIVEVILATVIPFLSGHITNDNNFEVVIGITGIAIAIITGVLAIYKFQENWVNYRIVCETLTREKFLFLTKTTPYDKPDSDKVFVKNIESILSKENDWWANNIAKPNKTKKSV